jgi:Uma2 family endonuclease
MVAASARMTLQEFRAIPGFDERRLELIDGEVYEKPLPRWGHGKLAIKFGRF